jgi:diguanylate cyclase (GGDEF)-like protein/PAS domain S-box-containing protein
MRQTYVHHRFMLTMAVLEASLGLGVCLRPQMFETPLYRGLMPHFPLFSAVMVTGALLLILLVRYPTPRIAEHLFCLVGAAGLIWFGTYLAFEQNGPASAALFTLATLTIISPYLPKSPGESGGDWLMAAIGLVEVVIALTMLVLPGSLADPMYRELRMWIPGLSLLGLVCGTLLAAPALQGSPPSSYALWRMTAGGLFPALFGILVMQAELTAGLIVLVTMAAWYIAVFGTCPSQATSANAPIKASGPGRWPIETLSWALSLMVVWVTGLGLEGAITHPFLASLFVLAVILYNLSVHGFLAVRLDERQRAWSDLVFYPLAFGLLHADTGYFLVITLVVLIILPLMAIRRSGEAAGKFTMWFSLLVLIAATAAQDLLQGQSGFPTGGLVRGVAKGAAFLLIDLLGTSVVKRTVALEQEVQQRERLLQSFLDHFPGPAFVRRLDGQPLVVNRWLQSATGIPTSELLSRPIQEVLPPEEVNRLTAHDTAVLSASGAVAIEESMAGRTFLKLQFTLRDGQGTPYAIASMATDITDRKRAEALLRDSEGRYRVLADTAQDGILMVEETGLIRFANPAMAALVGRPAEHLVHASIDLLLPPGPRQPGRSWIDYLSDTPPPKGSWCTHLWHSDGRSVPVEANLAESSHENRRVIIAVIRDMSERQKTEAELFHLAYRDSLTGLANRRMLLREIEQLSRDQAAALIYIDLDGFKTINDTYGHAIGDRFLKVIAARLLEASPRGAVVARMGGDEFTVLLRHAPSEASVTELAHLILTELSRDEQIGAQCLSVSPSIGVIFARQCADRTDMLRLGDVAMYEAKRTGRSRVVLFEESQLTETLHHHALLRDLAVAIDHGQLELYYQPVVNLQSGSCGAAEALVRWNRPGHGPVSPAQFIPLAEESGLIIPIGKWVFDQAVKEAAVWRERWGDEAPAVSINLSVRQFGHPGLLADVVSALTEFQLPSQSVQIEVTETIAADEQGLQCIRKLKALGFRMALDDFGTGYSSLNYLRNMDVDMLKVDRSFLMHEEMAGPPRQLLSSVVSMAQALGLEITMEGVETPSQLDMIRSMGFHRVQGYIIARPMPASQFRTWLEQTEPETVLARLTESISSADMANGA